MLYSDIMHPINLALLIYDALSVTVRSFSPETLVRKRIKKSSRDRHEKRKKELEERNNNIDNNNNHHHHRHSSLSRHGSRAGSVNTSLNVSAGFVSGELPPPVPVRNNLDSSRSHRHRTHSSNSNIINSDNNNNNNNNIRGHRERRSSRSSVIEEDNENENNNNNNNDDGVEDRGHKKRAKKNFSIINNITYYFRNWRNIDVTKQGYLLTHVLRATPVAALHFLCQLKTDVATLPLLRFKDLSETARRLLYLNEDPIFSTNFFFHFMLARIILSISQQYLMERMFLETNIVVRSLRSRRTWRNISAWIFRLCTHTLTDPIIFSVLSPILLNNVRDLSPVTGPLRYTPAGICKGISIGYIGVIIEMIIIPAAAQLCQRAVVRICDGAEYLLLRRYDKRTIFETTIIKEDEEEEEEEEDNNNNIHNSNIIINNSSNPLTDDISTISNNKDAEARERRRQRRLRVKQEKQKEEEERREEKEKAAEARVILRAIIYRIIATLIAQCLVQHPLTVLSHMLYSRAVLNATGLLVGYDNAPPAPLTWRRFLQFFKIMKTSKSNNNNNNISGITEEEEKENSGVPALEVLRSIGSFIGDEVSLIGGSIRHCSGQDIPIRELIMKAEERRTNNNNNNNINSYVDRASAIESAELMARSIASLSPLFTAVHFTAIDKLLGFYMATWVRLQGG